MDDRAPSVVMATARSHGPHLTVAGELDAEGAIRLRAQLDDAVAPGAQLTLDLSRVTHVSADALAVLVHAYKRLRDSGGRLVLSGASGPVIRVLRISGLDRVLSVNAAAVPEQLAAAAADS